MIDRDVQRIPMSFAKRICVAATFGLFFGSVGNIALAYSYTGSIQNVLLDCTAPYFDGEVFKQYDFGPNVFADDIGVMIEFHSLIFFLGVVDVQTDRLIRFDPDFSDTEVGRPFNIEYSLETNPSGRFVVVKREHYVPVPENPGVLTEHSISYKTYDKAVTTAPTTYLLPVNARIFMTKDFIWIETRDAPSDLGRTMVTPLFFGYGGEIADQMTSTGQFSITAATTPAFLPSCMSVKVATFSYSELQASIQRRYSRAAPYPFKEHGGSATALVSAIH